MNQAYQNMMVEILLLCDLMKCQDELLWHGNRDLEAFKDEPIKFMFNCSDTFQLGSADGEEITLERMPVLRQAVHDVNEITGADQTKAWIVTVIYCGRIRGQRPIKQFYTQEYQEFWPLFDSLGEPQETSS